MSTYFHSSFVSPHDSNFVNDKTKSSSEARRGLELCFLRQIAFPGGEEIGRRLASKEGKLWGILKFVRSLFSWEFENVIFKRAV